MSLMEEGKSVSEKSSKQSYLYITIILLVLFAVLISVLIWGDKTNKSLPTSTPSDTITSSQTFIEETASPSATQMENVTELQIEDEKVGTGSEAVAGKKVTVNYTGILTDGTIFDSNIDPKFNHLQPFSFTLGAGEVIPGWDQGVAGMKVGGKRKLTIPSSLAYGDNGVPGAIPGGATLIFEVELLEVE